MADVVVNDASLLDIGNAIREKNGLQTKYKPNAMGAAIRAMEVADKTPVILQGDLSNANNGGKLSPFFNVCGNRVQFGNVTNGTSMHQGASNLTEAPFAGGTFENMFADCTNLKRIYQVKKISSNDYDQNCSCKRAFYNCQKLEEIDANIKGVIDVRGEYIIADEMFAECHNLKKIGRGKNLFGTHGQSAGLSIFGLFKNCYALKEIDDQFLYALLAGNSIEYPNIPYWGGAGFGLFDFSYNSVYEGCLSLRRIKIVKFDDGSEYRNDNPFVKTFDRCAMVSSIIFSQMGLSYDSPSNCHGGTAIDLTTCGYASTPSDAAILEKLYGPPVTTDEEYAAHKNDPDWWTNDPKYSRYNVESAKNTLARLPKMKKGKNGGITFKLDAGAGTDTKDGPNTGAINTSNRFFANAINNANDYGWSVGFN